MSKLIATREDVVAAYRIMFGREPTETEIASQVFTHPQDIFTTFLFSDEFLNDHLWKIRERVLTRFTERYAFNVASFRSILNDFRRGQPINVSNGDHSRFLFVAYLAICSRLPDPIGYMDHMHRLQFLGADHLDTALLLQESTESTTGSALFIESLQGKLRANVPPYTFTIHDFSPSAVEQISKKPRLLIVSGAPRSGTTALKELLNSHKHVAVTNESRLLTLPNHLIQSVWLGDVSQTTTIEVSDAVCRLVDGKMASEIRLSLTSLRRYTVSVDYGRLSAQAMTEASPGAEIVGDKNPGYICGETQNTIDIAKRFPDADWLIIFRSPEETYRSQLRMGFVESKAQSMSIYMQCLINTMTLIGKLGRSRCCIVTHDRLFHPTTMRGEITKMCDFLGFSDQGPFLDFMQQQSHHPQAFSSGINLQPKLASRQAILDFVADQTGADSFRKLIDALGLWQGENELS